MEKKNIAIIVLAVALVASGVGNVILGVQSGLFQLAPPERGNQLNLVSTGQPYVLDPIDCWDATSGDLIDQVAETLFTYNLYDEGTDMYLEPQLATGFSANNNFTVFNFTLRKGVTFHDGTPFNATAAKWNIDRIAYWANHSDTLGEGPEGTDVVESYPAYIFHFPDGETPIWNKTEKINDYKIKMTLNAPFADLPDLFSYTATAMVSPTSTPFYSWLSLTDDILVGTGAYEFVHYKAGVELKFTKYENYWRENIPVYFDEVTLTYYDDDLAAQQALLAGQFDFGGSLPSLIPDFKASDKMEYINYTDKTGFPGMVTWYLGLNNNRWNSTFRKACSYAFNYSYYLEGLMAGTEVRAYGPVPPGIPGSLTEEELDYPVTNITIARQAMQAYDPATYGGLALDNDAAWAAVAATGKYNMTFWDHPYSSLYTDMRNLLKDQFEKIGVAVGYQNALWDEFMAQMKEDPNNYDIWWTGWAPDYLSPLNMMAPILHPESSATFTQVNDTQITTWLIEAYATDNETTLATLYSDIQKRTMEEVYPFITMSWSILDYVKKPDLVVPTYNPMQRVLYRTWYFK